MSKKHTVIFQKNILGAYLAGIPKETIAKSTGVSRVTIDKWIEDFPEITSSPKVSLRDFHDLQKRYNKLSSMFELLQTSEFYSQVGLDERRL